MTERYVGRYCAHVSIDFDIKGDLEGLKPFEEMRQGIREELTPMLREMIVDELALDEEKAQVKVIQMTGDLYRITEGKG